MTCLWIHGGKEAEFKVENEEYKEREEALVRMQLSPKLKKDMVRDF